MDHGLQPRKHPPGANGPKLGLSMATPWPSMGFQLSQKRVRSLISCNAELLPPTKKCGFLSVWRTRPSTQCISAGHLDPINSSSEPWTQGIWTWPPPRGTPSRSTPGDAGDLSPGTSRTDLVPRGTCEIFPPRLAAFTRHEKQAMACTSPEYSNKFQVGQPGTGDDSTRVELTNCDGTANVNRPDFALLMSTVPSSFSHSGSSAKLPERMSGSGPHFLWQLFPDPWS